MKPAPFEYFAPASVPEAISLLQRYQGEARVLAGGQSLVPLLNMRLARPAAVLDLNRTPGLDGIREDGGWIRTGAMARQRAVERNEAVGRLLPMLRAATAYIGHPQIRNRGTVGGSLAHAHPASELQAAALALGAQVTLTGPGGERRMDAGDFFVTYLTTALEPDEVLTDVAWPVQPVSAGWSFMEIARRHGDFALAGVAATLTRDRDDRCTEARVVLFGVGATAVRARGAEQLMKGERLERATFAEAGRRAAADLDPPPSDVHASGEYRRHLAGVLTQRALAEAAGRAAVRS